MKKMIKMLMVITVVLTVTAGVALAEWVQCIPKEVTVNNNGIVAIKVTQCNVPGYEEPGKDFKWIYATNPGSERVLAIALTSITLNKKISFNTVGRPVAGKNSEVITVGLK